MLIKGDTPAKSSFPPVEVKHSPVVEMVASLCVLADPSAHPTWRAWADALLASAHPRTMEDFALLSDITKHWSLALDLVCYVEQRNIDSVERFIANIESLDPVDFAYGMLSGLVPRRTIRAAFDGNLDALGNDTPIFRHYVSAERARDLILHARDYQQRMATFFRYYWEHVFSSTWQQIGVAELDCLASERRLLGQIGGEHYLGSCHDQIGIEEGFVRFRRPVELAYAREDIDRVNVIISTFIAPDTMVSLVDGCLTISKGVSLPFHGGVESSEEIAKFLKAIGSEMKLQILFELQKSPKTTKELADTLKVAPSSISAHLHQMREAALVHPQREQNAVYYHFLYENYQANIAYLAHIFETQ